MIPVVIFLAPRAAPPTGRVSRSGPSGGAIPPNAAAQIEDLNAQLLEMKLTVEGLEKERDFYFGKLRDIEVISQEYGSDDPDPGSFSSKVLQVLYATEVSIF